MVDKQEKEKFVQAIINNEYAEIELPNGHTLITDMDSKPYVHINDEFWTNEEKTVEILENHILDILTWDNGELYIQGNATYYDFFGIRFTY